MLNLENKEWKDFKIDKLFEVSGSITTHPSKLIKGGKTPRITCSSVNNGLDNLYLNQSTEAGGVLTVDSATIGYVSYQEVDFIATDHVEKIFFKNKKINRNLGLGLTTCIRNSTLNKFNYGYGFSQKRIKRQKILLPITEKNEPDYEYMENYTKSIIDKKLEDYKKYAESVLKDIEYKEIKPLENKEWNEFKIYDIFSYQRGKRQIEANRKKGNTPYYSASQTNNGLTDFISNPTFEIKTNAIIYSTFGDAYYVEKNFSTSDEITILTNNKLNKFNGLFIAKSINQNKSKYSFGRKAFSNKIGKDRIMLPINENNEPDFEYMEQYMKNITYKKINQYLNYKNKEA